VFFISIANQNKTGIFSFIRQGRQKLARCNRLSHNAEQTKFSPACDINTQ
jgi:hypothetical protein